MQIKSLNVYVQISMFQAFVELKTCINYRNAFS